MDSIYYKGQNGTGRKTNEQRELERKECIFKIKHGKFIVVFDDIKLNEISNDFFKNKK